MRLRDKKAPRDVGDVVECGDEAKRIRRFQLFRCDAGGFIQRFLLLHGQPNLADLVGH
jgi:hypothetical protein